MPDLVPGPHWLHLDWILVIVAAWPSIAVMSPSAPGICTSVAATEASLRSGETRSNCRVLAMRQPPYAAAAASFWALAFTSSMSPTM